MLLINIHDKILFVHVSLKYFMQSTTVFTGSHGLPEQSVDPKRSCGGLGPSSCKHETWVRKATRLINKYSGNKGHQHCKNNFFFFQFPSITKKLGFSLILAGSGCWKKDSYETEMLEQFYCWFIFTFFYLSRYWI